MEQDNSISKLKSNPTWKYFETLDSDKFEANCKLCGKNVPYETVSDLTNHVREHGEKPKDTDDEDETSEVQGKKSSGRKVSKLWKYFEDVDSEAKMASCLICQKKLSYISTITNLRRHLVRRHPEVLLNNEEDSKKVIISANGQLYEIETGGPHKVEVDDDDDEKDPIEMDTIYLEDLEDSMDQMPTPHLHSNTPKKKAKLSHKRNFSKISKEQVKSSRDTCSEEVIPKRTVTNTMGSLDYFGQYIVSLLKEVPSSVSNQLQNDIIKQIFASKLAWQSQASTKYTILNENDHNQSNEVTTDPVTYTISQSNDVTETTSNGAMVVESTENNETNN